jgi:demethylmenaquinone methyltransferase/2-methoxy-6-polyprenyl-1,4-benzoquinol methylase
VHKGLFKARRFFTKNNASSYDSIVRYATLGMDQSWKKLILKKIEGKTVLELASGTGILSEMIEHNTDAFQILGVDLSLDYIRISKNKRKMQSILNANAEVLPFTDKSCDCIVSSYLAKYADINKLVTEISRVIKSDGVVIFHDFTYPKNGIIRSLWKFHFKVLRIAGSVNKSWQHVFLELDHTIENSRWLEELIGALRDHNFSNVGFTYLTFGLSAMVVARKNE